ncbi:MAG: GntR family transcriptional regulator [Anaerococcus sp.]|nr:GntR family transcriptional regulator [Anaerococcus sp.]
MASKYSDLITKLIDQINTMEKGDKLPSERQLCKDFGVSRTTVRNAIGYLVNSGMLYQIQGKGTFIREQNSENLSNYYSFTEQTKKNGKSPKSLVLDFVIKLPSKKLREIFDLKEGEKIIQFERLRLADDLPMMYETTSIPYPRFEGISKELLEVKALYDIMNEDFKTKIYQVKERFSVSSLTGNKAKALKQNDQSPSLKIVRKSYDLENKLIEYTISQARADMFYYETSYWPN